MGSGFRRAAPTAAAATAPCTASPTSSTGTAVSYAHTQPRALGTGLDLRGPNPDLLLSEIYLTSI